MMRLFARASNHAALAPSERTLLKLIEGLACAALVAALPIISDALGHGASTGAMWGGRRSPPE